LTTVAAAGSSRLWAPRAAAAAGGRRQRFSTLTVDSLPKHVVECEYAVRGAVLLKAEELQKKTCGA